MRVSRFLMSSRSHANNGSSCSGEVLVLALVSAPDRGGDPSLHASRRSSSWDEAERQGNALSSPFLDAKYSPVWRFGIVRRGRKTRYCYFSSMC